MNCNSILCLTSVLAMTVFVQGKLTLNYLLKHEMENSDVAQDSVELSSLQMKNNTLAIGDVIKDSMKTGQSNNETSDSQKNNGTIGMREPDPLLIHNMIGHIECPEGQVLSNDERSCRDINKNRLPSHKN